VALETFCTHGTFGIAETFTFNNPPLSPSDSGLHSISHSD
jgi:hypothetical protein